MPVWSATCLSSESSDSNLSILVEYDGYKYIFNFPDGTTRAILQNKKGFRRTRALFASGVNTDRTSGLPGLLMTMADAGVNKLDVFGPSGMDHFMASTRAYTMRDTMVVKSYEISSSPSDSPVYKDEHLSVFAVPTFPGDKTSSASLPLTSSKRKNDTDADSDTESPNSRKRKRMSIEPSGSVDIGVEESVTESNSVGESPFLSEHLLSTLRDAQSWRKTVIQNMFPKKQVSSKKGLPTSGGKRDPKQTAHLMTTPLPRFCFEPSTLSYIVQEHRPRGKFDLARANALGLPKGKIRSRLTKGETVVTEDGKTITPDMVMGPAPLPVAMAFIDCPSPDHVPSLLHSKAFAQFQPQGINPIHCMFHLVGPKVLEDARYQQWLKGFGDNVHHLVAGHGITPDRIMLTSTAYAQLRLSHLDADMFQVPKCLPPPAPVENTPVNLILLQHKHFVPLKPLRNPSVPPDDDGNDLFHPAVQRGGLRDISTLLQPKSVEVFNRVRQSVVEEAIVRSPRPGDDIRVTPLGTSSAMPSKYRNVSSLIIQIPGSGNILLDCGEGTTGQLRRHFGKDAPSVIRDIKCIFISHIHGDHHIGLSKLLSQRRKMDPPCTDSLFLIVNQLTRIYLKEYSDLEDLGLGDSIAGIRMICAEHARWRGPSSATLTDLGSSAEARKEYEDSQKALEDLKAALDLTSTVTVDVRHRGPCYGLVIHHRDKWSLVYSGDTRPSEALVQAGHNATLLIHEATLADDQASLAAAKGHSTIGQAIDIAKRMGAHNVLLTHFSNRFPKTPPQMDTGDPTEDKKPMIAVAFDHVTVSIRDMWKLNRYLPAIEQSFVDSDDPEDEVVEAVMVSHEV